MREALQRRLQLRCALAAGLGAGWHIYEHQPPLPWQGKRIAGEVVLPRRGIPAVKRGEDGYGA